MLVHCRMLPGDGRRSNDSGGGDRDGRATEGSRADCCRGPQHRPGEDGRMGTEQGDCGGGDDGGD